MQLIYENQNGKIVFSGGGVTPIRLTEVNGLALPETAAEAVRYAGEAGQIVTNISVLPRTITASGDVYDKTGVVLAYILKVLSLPGRLTVATRRNARTISARCTAFVPGTSKGDFRTFTLQMVCDYPYFSDRTLHHVAIYEKIGQLKSSFSFPCVFSQRNMSGNVLNKGTVPVLPQIQIFAPEEAECRKGIVLENKTTGARLKLSCVVRKGETITVDCENRKIHGNIQGNLLHALSLDSQMSAFSLVVGSNLLSAHIEDETMPVVVSCLFRCQYGEAIA